MSELKRQMRFLGTGAGDFHEMNESAGTEGFYYEAVKLGGRNIRRAASTLIGPDLLIDHHYDKTMQLCGVEPDSIRHLLITHAHFDHFNPVAIIDLALKMPEPFRVYGNTTVKQSLDFARRYEWDDAAKDITPRLESPEIECVVVKAGETFSVGDCKVTAVPANHMILRKYMIVEQEAFNYILEYEGKTIFYGLDSSWILPDAWEILADYKFDLCVLDGTFGNMAIDPLGSGHLNFEMLRKTVEQLGEAGIVSEQTDIVASHISQRSVEPHDWIADKLLGEGIILAYDGMTIEI